ncbi:carbohydrate ABC transporter permease [Ruania alba]|uniref:Raffinose/stachyose/melibiose transport system permease protein n=1 Tax=Ruania alba TaxID=648782 RepID=A0A1H5HJU4_9MICO|nr:carbohydrate ABC transporter permease [Ruania alba]SEE28253.1 raffinose/stachyose/melibiose transport system permease protein [Ruania alba]
MNTLTDTTRPSAPPFGTSLAPAPRPGRRSSWKRSLRLLPTHVVLIAICLAWTYPFVWMVSTAFKPASEVFTNGLSIVPENATLENFIRAWDTANFGQYTINSIVVAVGAAGLTVAMAALAGYALGRGAMPGKKLVVGVLVVTMFLPKGYTILPVFILVNLLGLNNTLFGVVLAETGSVGVVAILLYMGYFSQIPKELEESAIVDGAGYWRIFLKIMLPLAMPVSATVFIFNFIGAWQAFLIPLVFTLGAPELRTTGVGMYSFFGENSIDWTGLAAGAVISVVPIIIVFLFMQRYFIEGIAGAVKG